MKERIKTKYGLWQCFEQLARENNPRLVALVERREAQQLLKMRDTLKVLVTAGATKRLIASAKRLLAQNEEAAMKPGYTITLLPSWRSASFGERLALEMINATLWPLQHDERMTVLISLLAAQTDRMVENDDQVEAIIDLLRMQLKLGLHHETNPSRL